MTKWDLAWGMLIRDLIGIGIGIVLLAVALLVWSAFHRKGKP